MERLKENLEKWSFIDKYRHLDDLCPTLDSIEEGCNSLKHGEIIGASVFFYEAMEKLEFLRYCEKHGKDYVELMCGNTPGHCVDEFYAYFANKYLVSIDDKDVSEFSEKFYACLEHLKSIDFSEFGMYLNPNNLYADYLPNGCKEGDEFISLINIFIDFMKENIYVFVEDDFVMKSLIDNYKDRNYVYVGQVIKEKVDRLGFGLNDNIDSHENDYSRALREMRRCFYRFYSVACNLKLKKID